MRVPSSKLTMTRQIDPRNELAKTFPSPFLSAFTVSDSGRISAVPAPEVTDPGKVVKVFPNAENFMIDLQPHLLQNSSV